MKISCGTDIIETERIKNAIERNGERFLHTVFTESEVEYCEARKAQKYQHYAARFAVKEATFKALSDYIKDNFSWTDFEVLKMESGKPKIHLKYDIDTLIDIDVSISHCKEYATANVVAIFND